MTRPTYAIAHGNAAVQAARIIAAVAADKRPPVAVQQLGDRWSFDDMHIGLIKDDQAALHSRDVRRPQGLSNVDWYSLAGAIIRLLNRPTSAP